LVYSMDGWSEHPKYMTDAEALPEDGVIIGDAYTYHMASHAGNATLAGDWTEVASPSAGPPANIPNMGIKHNVMYIWTASSTFQDLSQTATLPVGQQGKYSSINFVLGGSAAMDYGARNLQIVAVYSDASEDVLYTFANTTDVVGPVLDDSVSDVYTAEDFNVVEQFSHIFNNTASATGFWSADAGSLFEFAAPLALDPDKTLVAICIEDDSSAGLSDTTRRGLSIFAATAMTADVPQNIVYDNVSEANITPGTSLSWSHTIGGGSNRLLVVGTGAEDNVAASMVVTSVTYDGTAMTPVAGGSSTVDTGYIMKTDLYYMLDGALPAAGSYTVVVTYAAAVDQIGAGAISLANVAQQGAEAVNTATSTSTGISTNLTTLTDGAWIVDVAGCGNPGSMTATGAGQTERFDVATVSSTTAGSTMLVATAGSATMSWDFDGSVNRQSQAAAAFAPATGAPPVNDPPVADAGPDQNVTDNDDNGSEDVTLDGSGSSDSDGTIVSYEWEENSSQIATGVGPTVTLNVAVHTIDLIVTDNDSDTDTDSVQITVNSYVNDPPTADAGANQSVTDNDDSGDEDVTLDGSGHGYRQCDHHGQSVRERSPDGRCRPGSERDRLRRRRRRGCHAGWIRLIRLGRHDRQLRLGREFGPGRLWRFTGRHADGSRPHDRPDGDRRRQ